MSRARGCGTTEDTGCTRATAAALIARLLCFSTYQLALWEALFGARPFPGRTPAVDISPLHPAATPRPLRFAYGPGARA
jgi:hypothetical protein